jgi:hypothetical protein
VDGDDGFQAGILVVAEHDFLVARGIDGFKDHDETTPDVANSALRANSRLMFYVQFVSQIFDWYDARRLPHGFVGHAVGTSVKQSL